MRLRLLLLIAILLTPLPTYCTPINGMSDKWNIIEEVGYKQGYQVNVILTFYTDLASCNSYENKGKNAIGGYLTSTSIAIPRKSMPFGSKIILSSLPDSLVKDYDNDTTYERIADDVGSVDHIRIRDDGIYRFDVYCPRLYGETDSEYKSRINSYGKYETTVTIYEKDGDN